MTHGQSFVLQILLKESLMEVDYCGKDHILQAGVCLWQDHPLLQTGRESVWLIGEREEEAANSCREEVRSVLSACIERSK